MQNAIVKLELNNQLFILYVDVRSLEKTLNILSILIKSLNVNLDIITVSETWETVSNSNYIFIPGYIKLSNGRKEGRKGGGVALLIKHNLYFTICDNYKISSFESVLIELSGQVNSKKTIIGAIYRPPNTDKLTVNIEFDNLLRSITKGCASCILLGDYNINLFNSSTDQDTDNFLKALFTNSVLLMITQSTRYGDQSATLIDNVITNKYLGQHLSGILLNDFSDHFPIFFGDISIKCHSEYFMKKVQIVSDNNLNCFEKKD